MDIVAVDILSGLPVTPGGMRYIIVISDYFTKYSRAFALPDAEAATCMRAMYNGCLLYTSPSPRDGLLSRMPSSA